MDRPSDVLPDEEHARIFRDQVVPAHNLDLAASQQRPAAVILGGQPGSGKDGLARTAQLEFGSDVITVDPDELRRFHPRCWRLGCRLAGSYCLRKKEPDI